MKEFNFEAGIETPKWKRIPITVEIEGKKENIWVNYIVEMKPEKGTCIECGKEEQTMPCESVKEVKVEASDERIVQEATEKVKELVRKHEEKMFVCKDCLNDDFIKRRPELYIKALEEAQDELNIEVDKEKQRESILGNTSD